MRLGFDPERLHPRVNAIVRARRQQLGSKLADIASKRGLVLFDGRAMTDAEARLRFRRLQSQQRGMVAELLILFLIMLCLAGVMGFFLRFFAA